MPAIFQPGGDDSESNNRRDEVTAQAQSRLEKAAPDDQQSFVEASEQNGRIVVNGSIQPPFDMDEFCGAIWNAIDLLRQANGKGNVQIARKAPTAKETLDLQSGGALPQPHSSDAADRTQQIIPIPGETQVLDTKARREFLARATSIAKEGASQTALEKIGCLTVIAGKSDQSEYILTGKLTLIGKSDMASIKIAGWFAPKVAAIISRKPNWYSIAPSGKAGTTKVNSQPLTSPRDLQEGDIIEVAGTKLQFYFRE